MKSMKGGEKTDGAHKRNTVFHLISAGVDSSNTGSEEREERQ